MDTQIFLKNLKKFEEGKCFLCNKECEKEAYCHYDCALAYSDEKLKRTKEAWKQSLN